MGDFPHATGTVANFTNCTHIDADGVHYFEFALTVFPPPPEPTPPQENVYYVNPSRPNISDIIALVAFSWWTGKRIKVFLDANDTAPMRVSEVLMTLTHDRS